MKFEDKLKELVKMNKKLCIAKIEAEEKNIKLKKINDNIEKELSFIKTIMSKISYEKDPFDDVLENYEKLKKHIKAIR